MSKPDSADVRPPNFLIIQCDDLGWDDIGLNNPRVHTPNIDALARQSARFSSFTVNPVCAPSRAAFLTGRYFLRTGVSHVHGGKDFLHLSEKTLADHLHAAGYATGMWGKWHSGDADGYHPWQRGFDEAYMAQLYLHRATTGRLNGKPVEHQGWADAVMVDHSIDFMRRHRDRRFFAYLPTMTPHAPHDAPDEWVARYAADGISPALAKLWGMVSFLDEQIGRLFAAMEELGLAENTVVVFMSDNGPAIESSSLDDEDRKLRRVNGLRGWKGDLYENAVRSPLYIRWPGKFTARDIDAATDLVDLAPSLLAMASARPLDGAPPMDGRSFLNVLTEPPETIAPRPIFNYAHRGWLTSGPPYSLRGIPGEYAPLSADQRNSLDPSRQSLSVRVGKHKLVVNPGFDDYGKPESVHLFDLADDPDESRDISGQNPDLRGDLLDKIHLWWNEIRAQPHAFTAPVFPIRNGSVEIAGNAPCHLSGSLVNTVIGLGDWSAAGDFADYALRVEADLSCRISLRWNPEPPPDTRIMLAIVGTENAVELPANGTALLHLTTGDCKLRISLPEAPPEQPSSLPMLRRIIIQPAK